MEDLDKQNKKIIKILGEKESDTENNLNNTNKYYNYLKANINYPCKLTGMQDFPWEERFVFGCGDEEEYEELKKENPSYTDSFELIELLEPENTDIFAKVRRISDSKIFKISLDWLTAVDEENPNYQLLEDYSSWWVNY